MSSEDPCPPGKSGAQGDWGHPEHPNGKHSLVDSGPDSDSVAYPKVTHPTPLHSDDRPTSPVLNSITTDPLLPAPTYGQNAELRQETLQSGSLVPDISGFSHTSQPAAIGSKNDPTFLQHADQDAPRDFSAQDHLNQESNQHLRHPPPKSSTPLDQATPFWEAYNKAGNVEDKEFVKSSGGDLDVLLIFAGLFSAIDTAFIIESYKSLKPDPTDEAAKLLRSVVLILHNSTYTDDIVNPPSFTAAPRDIRVNALFFASLCCSLSAAFGAVMAKQWLTQYDKDGEGALKTPVARGRERQLKYEGRDKWGLEDIITTLPTLLQFSLFFFFVGLSDFIWPLNVPVASVILCFAAATFLFYATTISISVMDRSSPFQTRLSSLLRRLPAPRRISVPWSSVTVAAKKFFRAICLQLKWEMDNRPYWLLPLLIPLVTVKYIGNALVEQFFKLYKGVVSLYAQTTRSHRDKRKFSAHAGSVDSRCVVYLLERMTVPKDLDMLAEMVTSLPDNSGARAIAEGLTTFHLKPFAFTSLQLPWHPSPPIVWYFPGLRGPSWRAIVKMACVIVEKWRYFEASPPVTGSGPEASIDAEELRGFLVLALWDIFLANPEDEEVYALTSKIFLALASGSRNPTACVEPGTFEYRGGIASHLTQGTITVQERTLRMVCLLPSIGCGPRDVRRRLIPVLRTSTQLVEVLRSTMWEGQGLPDLESFWLANLRVEALSILFLNHLQDSHFVEYIARWFDRFARPAWRDLYPLKSSFRYPQGTEEQEWLYWTYLLSVRRLLQHENNRAWSQELVEHQHLWCLRVILEEFPHSGQFIGAPLALSSLLCLWSNEDHARAQMLTTDWAYIIVDSLAKSGAHIEHIVGMMDNYQQDPDHQTEREVSVLLFASEMGQTLKWLFSYLEMAKQGDILDQRLVTSAATSYAKWSRMVDVCLSTNEYGALSSRLKVVLSGLAD